MDPNTPDSRCRLWAAPVSSFSIRRETADLASHGSSDMRPRTHSEQSLTRPQLVHASTEPTVFSKPDFRLGLDTSPPSLSPTRSSDRSSGPTSQHSIPLPMSSATQPPPLSSTPSHPSHIRPVPTSGRQAVSTASHAAQALEKEQKERRKAEKEREEKEKERERERERAELERSNREEREREQQWGNRRTVVSNSHLMAGSSGYGSPVASRLRSASSSLVIGNGKSRVASTAGVNYA